MHYVILRDDDTNAFTPPECLEQLYRPYLDRGWSVNLATIPEVRTDAVGQNGQREQFLPTSSNGNAERVAIGTSQKLVNYLRANPGFHILQHGYDHSVDEFDSVDADDVRRRFERGAHALAEAGFAAPRTFVAPYDRFSRIGLSEAARRFPVVSTGWFELGRVPHRWWPRYFLKQTFQQPHWRINHSHLLSHPGCLLSCHRPRHTMLESVQAAVTGRTLTVLVTHWWEYFRDGAPDLPFIGVLHEVARWLSGDPDIRVVSFDDVADGKVPLT